MEAVMIQKKASTRASTAWEAEYIQEMAKKEAALKVKKAEESA